MVLSYLFKGSVPPVMAFHLGSLGFLTPFKFESFKTEVDKVFEGREIESFSFSISEMFGCLCCFKSFCPGSCR